MINNLANYFNPEMEIFLDSVNYTRIKDGAPPVKSDISLLYRDNINVTLIESGILIVISRSLTFDPKTIFELSVSFGAVLKFNENKDEVDWRNLNLAEEFRENGDFITVHLISRIDLLIGQITSSFGQQPIILPGNVIKKKTTE